jgi:hypothetical protein
MLELRGERLEVVVPSTPTELASSLPAVLAAAESGRSVWVECFELDDRGDRDEPWTQAWLELLARANERRDRLRGGTKGGVLFVGLSLHLQSLRSVAPDLWSARGFTLHVPASPRPSCVLPQLSLPDALFPSSTLASIVDELERQGPAPTVMRLELLVRAAAAALSEGRRKHAAAYAKQAREIETESSAHVLLLVVEALLELADGELQGAHAKIDAALKQVSERLGRPGAEPRGKDGAALAKSSGKLRDELRVLVAELAIHAGDPEKATAYVDSLVADAEARDPDTDLPVVLRALDRAGRAHLQHDELERAEAFLRRAEQRLEQPRSERERMRWASLREGTRHASILDALARTLLAQGREAEARAAARRARTMGALAPQLGAEVTLLRIEWPEASATMEARKRHRETLAEIAARAKPLVARGIAGVRPELHPAWRAELSVTAAATFDAMLILADAEFERDGRFDPPEELDIVRFADSVAACRLAWTWTLRRAIARLAQARRADDHVEHQPLDEAAELCDSLQGHGTFVVRRTTWCVRAGLAWAHTNETWPPPSSRSRAAVEAVLADAPSEPGQRDAFTDVLLAMGHRFFDAYSIPLAIACASKGVEWASAFASSPAAKLEDFDRVQRCFRLWAEAYYSSQESRPTGIQILRDAIAWAQAHGSSKQRDASIELLHTELRLAEFMRASGHLDEARATALDTAARARKLTFSSTAAHEVLTRALALAGGYNTAARDPRILAEACAAAVAWIHADPWSAGAERAPLGEHWRRNEEPAAEWCAQLHSELTLATGDPEPRKHGWELHDAVRRAVSGLPA